MTDINATPVTGVKAEPPTLASLDSLNIAALLYRIEGGEPRLIDVNARARLRLSLDSFIVGGRLDGEPGPDQADRENATTTSPVAGEPWQWLNGLRVPMAANAHPALAVANDGPMDSWSRYHLRLPNQTLIAVQLRTTRFAHQVDDSLVEHALIAIGDIAEVGEFGPCDCSLEAGLLDHADRNAGEPDTPESVDTDEPDADRLAGASTGRMTIELPRTHSRLRRMLSDLPMSACVVDKQGYLRMVNRAFCQLFDYPERELVDTHFRRLLPSEARTAATAYHAAHFPYIQARRRTTEVITRDGTRLSLLVEDSISYDEHGNPLHIAFLFDITDRMETERQLQEKNRRLEYLAASDELTALPNRRHGLERLKKAMARSQRYGEQLSVAMLDLDHFKEINDKYGHPVGDSVLVDFSRLVERTIRRTDTLIRWGGEEFLLLLPGLDRFSAKAAIVRLLEKLKQARLGGLTVPVTFSAGVGEHIDEEMEPFLEAIDRALYQAKSAGRGCISLTGPGTPARGFPDTEPCSRL